jgi:hypothetical protein
MGKELEIIVGYATGLRELKRGASSTYTGLRTHLGRAENEIIGRLKGRQKIPKDSEFFAEIVMGERGGNGVSYKEAINIFCEEHPEFREDFEGLVSAQRTELVQRVNYGLLV